MAEAKLKKRILFVDDEPNILRGLQRSLRPLRSDWDMHFVQGAAQALKSLEQEIFDVIVTDMRMPEMDGTRLLDIVRKKYPAMVRIILSGHSDQKMIMKSFKTAHQYLAKPCEKQTLISAVTRACSLRDLLNQKGLQDLLGKIETLPSIPSLYARITEELQSPDASGASVGDIVANDMGMTAKILQLINSSFLGMPRHISSTQEAVIFLGIDVVKTLVLGIEVFSAFKTAPAVISVEEIHDHCIRTGQIARTVAECQKMDAKECDNAMISGILHDLGKLLFAEYVTAEYQQVIQRAAETNVPLFQMEKEIFGVTHAEVGAYLLGLWGLPEAIVQAIAFHHSPGGFASESFELCGIVHVAELMEHHEAHLPGGWEKLTGADEAYLKSLGLTGRISLWRDYLQKNI